MSANFNRLNGAKLQDVMANPGAYGMPTLQEYMDSPDKYRGRDDDRFSEAEKGAHNLKRVTKKIIHEIEGYRCKNLEEVERIAKSQGIPVKDLDYQPSVQQAGAGKYDIIVRWVSKQKRLKWA